MNKETILAITLAQILNDFDISIFELTHIRDLQQIVVTTSCKKTKVHNTI
jgi:hypothetical protein